MLWCKFTSKWRLKVKDFDKIYFLGDKTEIGGNDYEIYISPLTISYKTIGPDNTIEILQNNFL